MTIEGILRTWRRGAAPTLSAAVIGEVAPAPPLDDRISVAAFRRLPERHRALLHLCDGITMMGGSYRLFGWKHGRRIDPWNAEGSWKFAWAARARDYYCFGESVLGNQYAYRLSELRGNKPAPVYELYAVTLDEIARFPDFDTFLVDGFLNGVRDDAYHQRIAAARAAAGGDFAPAEHRAYMPSPLLTGGQVAGAQLIAMDAHAHMIANGDLFGALAHRQSLAGLYGLENYSDAQGRPRIRTRWGPPSLQ